MCNTWCVSKHFLFLFVEISFFVKILSKKKSFSVRLVINFSHNVNLFFSWFVSQKNKFWRNKKFWRKKIPKNMVSDTGYLPDMRRYLKAHEIHWNLISLTHSLSAIARSSCLAFFDAYQQSFRLESLCHEYYQVMVGVFVASCIEYFCLMRVCFTLWSLIYCFEYQIPSISQLSSTQIDW